MKKVFIILLIIFGLIISACSQTVVRNALLIRIGNDTVYIRANGTHLEIYSSDTTQFNNVIKFLANVEADQYINFKGADGTYGAPHPRIYATGDTLGFADENGSFFLRDLLAGISLVDTLIFTEGNVKITSNTGSPDDALRFSIDGDIVSIQNVDGENNVLSGIAELDLTPIATPPLAVLGAIYCDADDSTFYQYDGNNWVPLGTGGGGSGSGTVTTDLNQVAYGTGTNTVGGGSLFIYKPDSAFVIYSQATTSNYAGIKTGLTTYQPKTYVQLRTWNGATQASLSVQHNSSGARDVSISTDYFYIDTDSSKIYGLMRLMGQLHLNYLNLASTDTVALIAIGNEEVVDSASLVPTASKAWDVELKPWEDYYNESERLKALPLVMPNGKARRKMNAMFMPYQTEYELETHARYMDELFNRVKELEKENAKLSRKPKRKQFNELLMRVESLEQRVDGLEQKVCGK
jgi:hypothetical protein